MYTDVCDLEKFVNELKNENDRVKKEISLAEENKRVFAERLETDCRKRIDDSLTAAKEKLQSEFKVTLL